ncbi:Hypothetical protein R9X50_00759400 [Acrodontium crateriforme]|uniref:Uncharacterized protein n=1 Tax=Acrodontium crateriforme TaxID=150365 RepID=A0AAQ3R7U8_9PEZI|nr:Hypothetical protein R9X50_00759400 [Acrodontium crateriforme]
MDHISNVLDAHSPSPLSLLSHLPQIKRADAAITRAAATGIPEQGEQTGGYTEPYTWLAHVPLLPLYSAAQHDLLAKQQCRKDRLVADMDRADPDKMLTAGQRGLLSVVGHLSGGGSMVSVKRFERRLIGANVVSSGMLMKQHKLAVFTRWTIPGPRGEVEFFVDVFEHRFIESNYKFTSGNLVLVKVGLPPTSSSGKKKDVPKVTLKLLQTEAKELKSQKMWKKHWNTEACEAVSVVRQDGREEAMVIVARIQRACSTVEIMEITKRFDKEWIVPVV